MRHLLFIAALGGTLATPGALAQSANPAPGRPAMAPDTAPASAGVLQLLREVDALKRELQSLRGQVEDQGYALGQLRQQVEAAGHPPAQLGAVPPAEAPLPTLTPPANANVAGKPVPEAGLQVETEAGTPPPEASPEAAVQADGELAPPPAAAAEAPTPATAPVAPPPPAEAAAPAATPGQTVDDATSEAAYRDAFALLRSGDYDRAIAAFTDFQAQHPHSQYGDNAQYWLAEAYYAKGQYAPAIAEYQKMQSQYPASKKLSHAMLKTGYSYDKLGKAQEANATLNALIQQFPGSAAARLAEERLAQIKSGKAR